MNERFHGAGTTEKSGMANLHLKAKKSLGQHFLRSKSARSQIIEAAKLSSNNLVLEVGPGKGELTEALLGSGARVVAVETDVRCVLMLTERFASAIASHQLRIIEGDIRTALTQKEIFRKINIGKEQYKLVANIPYYITGYLFRLFLEQLRQPMQIVFLVQKEVALQIVSRDGKEGILSLAVKVYGEPRYVATVKREAFSPPPKVDSAIISVENISHEKLGLLTESRYFALVKAGLGERRKVLIGNIFRKLNIPKPTLEKIFTTLHIDPRVRGEDVPAEKWLLLAHALRNYE